MCKLSAHCRIISTDGETSFVTDKEIDDMKSALTSFKGNEQSVGISVGSHVRVTQVQIIDHHIHNPSADNFKGINPDYKLTCFYGLSDYLRKT